jgi:TatD DNase family protein
VSADWLSRLELLVRNIGCGIGETGLDKRCRVDLRRQEQVFLAQLELACMYDRPLVIHCVRSWGKLIELLDQNTSLGNTPPMMIHSFSGSMETMERLTRRGIFLSFSGALLDPEKKKLQQVFARTPKELLLLETDSPDQFFDVQGKKTATLLNEPMFISALYDKAAQIRKMDLKQLSTIVWHNGSVFTHRKTFGK